MLQEHDNVSRSWLSRLGSSTKEVVTDQDRHQELLAAVEQAKNEWHAASNYFDAISEPELVDYAVLTLGAAERKYMYLLEQVKKD